MLMLMRNVYFFCTRVCKHFRNSNSKSSNGRLPLRENLTRI